MPQPNANFTTAPGSPGNGILDAIRRLASLEQRQPAQPPPIDPEKARQLLLRGLYLVCGDGERNVQARDALRRLAGAAKDLLELLALEE